MSISTRHSIVPFVAGTTVAMTDQRLAKVGYKTTKKTPAKFQSVAVSLPALQITPEDCVKAMPYIATMFANAQDGIVRSLYESSGGTLREVSDDDVSVASCLAFMEAEENGSRLTVETIKSWFTTELSDYVQVMIAEKLKFAAPLNADQSKVVAKHTASVQDVICSLSGGKTSLTDKAIAGCRIYLALGDSDDEMISRLSARLDAMEKKNQEMAARDASLANLLGITAD